MTCYLAVDIGASSGRHIVGRLVDGKIVLEEVYRFENGMAEENGTLVWDIERLTNEVIAGLAAAKEKGYAPAYVAIDTWGVDYVLLDENDREILPAVAYRDSRNVAAMEEAETIVPHAELYARTGIQKQPFNSVYQLYADKVSGRLERAKRCLFIPDYLTWRLTGVKENEYTIASTSGMLSAETGDWDGWIFERFGIPRGLFGDLKMPGTAVGPLKPEIEQKVGFSATVLHAPSHDTASAVAACPIDDECVYLSSGTWSLIGTENAFPVVTKAALEANFTNEGGVERRYRFLDNLMGMWLFQRIRADLGRKYTYDEMMELGKQGKCEKTFAVTSPELLAPENMCEAVKALVGEDLSLPDLLSTVYHSLAKAYDDAVKLIEEMCGKTIKSILIVGGGSKDRYLNALTAETTGKTVVTGLSEATALGNVLTQIMYDKRIDLASARAIVKNSFDIKEITA
ncbi:MAG: rhamnulokinase [Clostridia bacterium]|nr:rhamnulokinase [Clostridia bacterium]